MKIDFDHWKGSQIGDDIQINLSEERDFQIFRAFNPVFSKDGNQYCFLYGTLPNDCIVGFGDTPQLAMKDFCNNYFNQKATNQ